MFRMKQKIYLLWENFKTKQFCEKLNYWKIKAFKIKQQTESIIFELKLSEYSRAHFIVHVTLLKSALENTRLAKIINAKKYKNQNYVIEKILEKNQIKKINYYFVK